ncbi:non-functional NADPH-dependent codeinone reductase 2-like isoform X2 [Rhododendron vialii]|uniref:non-functional NADPH-dependent codeinone reductase 2-like isoform X2 n=1 Tax=Rhododendron vialii TaxID=182163 RepID=UPI00265F3818|nr:non-functional NADPH-dependent codeinone reductase 2-like isoform X2 [Rhododendron vialii]
MAFQSTVPEVTLSSGQKMPVLGLGTATYSTVASEIVVQAVVQAIELGYRHFDTASFYQTESSLGDAIQEAIRVGLIKSREEVFLTSKLGCTDAHPHLVVPALQTTLRNLKTEYLDLYLIHFPISMKHGISVYTAKPEDFLPLDIKSVWAEMEECQRLGLTKSIGVSNFSCKKLGDLLAFATIPPAVNQVELNPCWQQKKLRDYCKANGILVVAHSPLGSLGTSWGHNRVMESEVLKEIAEGKGKTVAQICLRWEYEQGIGVAVKSYNKERQQQNLAIFDWALSDEDCKKIGEIPQRRGQTVEEFVDVNGPFKSIDEIWDGEI